MSDHFYDEPSDVPPDPGLKWSDFWIGIGIFVLVIGTAIVKGLLF